LTFAWDPLLDLADRVVALDKKSPAPVKLVFGKTGIELVAKSPVGMVSRSLEAENDGWQKNWRLWFNYRFLADAVGNLVSVRAEIRLAENLLSRPKPVLIADAQ